MKEDLPITLVASSLGAGGAERILTLLASRWSSSGRSVTIVTLGNDCCFYPLPDTVNIFSLAISGESGNIASAMFSNLYRLFRLRCFLKKNKFGVVLSFGTETNVLVLLSLIGFGSRVIISERCDPRYYPSKYVWKLLRRITYPLATQVVVQTTVAKRYFHFLKETRLKVVPNPVETPKAVGLSFAMPKQFILAAGRLTRQKGFDVLLGAFALIVDKFPDWSLVIAGEGDERKELEARVQELELQNNVLMPGIVDNLGDYMKAAQMFVLSSRYEGFPNVLTEAMASGLAVIATDCPSGPSDIVRHGQNGLLVPVDDEGAIASQLSLLISQPKLRYELGYSAKDVSGTFSFDCIMDKWESIFTSVIGKQ